MGRKKRNRKLSRYSHQPDSRRPSRSADLARLLDEAITSHEQGKLKIAEERYRRIIKQFPENPESLYLLGVLRFQQEDYQEALKLCSKAAALNPREPRYCNALGKVFYELGNIDSAFKHLRRAVELDPQFHPAHFNLGRLYLDRGSLNQAEESFRKVLSLVPDHPEARLSLIEVLISKQCLDSAEALACEAVRNHPDNTAAYGLLGRLLAWRGKNSEAESVLRTLLEKDPSNADGWILLAGVLAKRFRVMEAMTCLRKVLSRDPRNAAAHADLASILEIVGDLEGASHHGRLSSEYYPESQELVSNYLLGLNYLPNISREKVFTEHVSWAERTFESSDSCFFSWKNEFSPEKKLRIGYVSSDFRVHSVAYFIRPLLEHHDSTQTEVICYSSVAKEDSLTEELKSFTDVWRPVFGMSHENLARKISEDKIDILVDLNGHTAGNRLAVFAMKPAPIQVTYLGYPNTTGLSQMDYRLVDEWTDPAGQNEEAYYTETLVRIPGGFSCYRPLESSPPVGPLPSETKPFITFASFNNMAKVNDRVLSVWAKILQRVSRSRLMLKFKYFQDEKVREMWLEKLARQGISREHVELRGYQSSTEEHLQFYNEADIALDPFPYNGATTTCESLWMGVPVVTLRGDRHAGRVGVSILTRVGLHELIADSIADYIGIAVDLASDRSRLARLRAGLRDRLWNSPLTHGKEMAREIEKIYREMWRRYCGNHNEKGP